MHFVTFAVDASTTFIAFSDGVCDKPKAVQKFAEALAMKKTLGGEDAHPSFDTVFNLLQDAGGHYGVLADDKTALFVTVHNLV